MSAILIGIFLGLLVGLYGAYKGWWDNY